MSSQTEVVERSESDQEGSEETDSASTEIEREELVSKKVVNIIFHVFRAFTGLIGIFLLLLSFAFFGTTLSQPLLRAGGLFIALAGVFESMKQLILKTDSLVSKLLRNTDF